MGWKDGLPQTTTLAPSTSPAPIASQTARGQVSRSDTSATGSRSVRKTVASPGRRTISVSCPSTQTRPSRLTQSPIAREIVRTGSGCSGEEVSATEPP